MANRQRGDYISWLRAKVGPAPVILNFAGACVVDRERVLLQRRADRSTWGFPGGAVELGESVTDAVVRETREETGLTVQVDAMLGVYSQYLDTYPNGDRAQTITTFLICTPLSGQLSSADPETLDLRWLDLASSPDLVTPQHDDAWADLAAGRRGVVR